MAGELSDANGTIAHIAHAKPFGSGKWREIYAEDLLSALLTHTTGCKWARFPPKTFLDSTRYNRALETGIHYVNDHMVIPLNWN